LGVGRERLDGLRVRAEIESDDRPHSGHRAQTSVEPDGTFVLDGLQPAHFTITLRGDGAWADPVVGVPSGTVDLVVRAQPMREIEGRVLVSDKLDPRSLKVRAWPVEGNGRSKHADVAQDGSFVIRGLRPGRYRLVASSSVPRMSTEREVEAGETGVLIELAESSTR
jgi:hypothetical protein